MPELRRIPLPERPRPKSTVRRAAGQELPRIEKSWLVTFNETEWGGRSYEDFLLGQAPQSERSLRAMQGFILKKGPRHAPETEFFDVVRQNYDGDPINPPTDFARALRGRVVELSGLKGGRADLIRYYSAVGEEAIDRDLGVDAWIELAGPRGKYLDATLDATIDPNKFEKGSKSDIVIYRAPAFAASPHFDEAVAYYAGRVWERLQSEMKVAGVRLEQI
jgi:hypothetical protein